MAFASLLCFTLPGPEKGSSGDIAKRIIIEGHMEHQEFATHREETAIGRSFVFNCILILRRLLTFAAISFASTGNGSGVQ